MAHIVLDIPEESWLSLKLSDDAAAGAIRLAAAAKLYELGKRFCTWRVKHDTSACKSCHRLLVPLHAVDVQPCKI